MDDALALGMAERLADAGGAVDGVFKRWSEVSRWNWLWHNVKYSDSNVWHVVGKSYLEAQLRALIANRILYPDGTVHSYVTRFLRDRVVKLLEKKPPVRRTQKVK